MHADNRRIDHLHGCVMRGSKCVHNRAPDAERSFTRRTLHDLFGSIGLMTARSWSVSS